MTPAGVLARIGGIMCWLRGGHKANCKTIHVLLLCSVPLTLPRVQYTLPATKLKTATMHRFLPGILLIQLISVVILWINIPDKFVWDVELALKIVLPLLLLGISTAFWFEAIARNRAAGIIARLKEAHAKDREKLHAQTEREKTRVRQDAHREIVREQRRVNSKANLKVGAAFFAAAGAGLVMLITELITFGLMTLMTAGGALSGYFYRGRREASRLDVTDAAQYDSSVVSEQVTPPRQINPPDKSKRHSSGNPASGNPVVKKSAIRSSDNR